MKLIVGLGNPWKEYAMTKHNAWFIVVDRFVERHAWTTFLMQKKFDAEISQGMWKKRQTLMIKPMTFMNKSGETLKKVMQFYQVTPEQTLIIHDELDLPAGTIKLKFNGGHGGHNGLRSIFEQCGSQRFRRIRIGIGRPVDPRFDISDRVLSALDSTLLTTIQTADKLIDEKVGEYFQHSG